MYAQKGDGLLLYVYISATHRHRGTNMLQRDNFGGGRARSKGYFMQASLLLHGPTACEHAYFGPQAKLNFVDCGFIVS